MSKDEKPLMGVVVPVTGKPTFETNTRANRLNRLALLQAVVDAARAVYESDDFITKAREGDGREDRDQTLGNALAALDKGTK